LPTLRLTKAEHGDTPSARRDPSPNGTVKLTGVAWAAQRELDVAEWTVQGRKLGTIGRQSPWWVGDWVRYGNAKFGERYVRASRITGYDIQTLKNMAYVASRFDPSRRRDELSWSHHAEVAALPPEEQDRWLSRVQADHLSVKDLRHERARMSKPDTVEGPAECGEHQSGDGAETEESHVSACPNCGCPISPVRSVHDVAGKPPSAEPAETPTEIERKFLVDDVPSEALGDRGVRVDQGYLSIGEDEVRVRRKGDALTLCVKRGHGLVRVEQEVAIDSTQFDVLWPLTEGRRVSKRRIALEYDGRTIELDVYGGASVGLLTAEVEFESRAAAERFVAPPWFGREVTDDDRYKNRKLAA
jgi:CYTH domain-containing protein